MFLLVIKIVIFIVVIVGVIYLFMINKALKYEKRIGAYSTYSINYESGNLMSYISSIYNRFTSKLEGKITNSKRYSSWGNRYGKYIIVGDDINLARFIIDKVVIGFLFVILVIVSLAIQNKSIKLFHLIFSFVFGYYVKDIYLVISNKIKLKKIRNDMLRAVIIMNNAFKAGKSIMQATYIVSQELPNPIKGEFEKIYQDMLYGLSADVVFDRFAKRIGLEEAKYISSSLIILNKTGGNIVKVFDSIEKTLFDRKQLNEELKNATAASNLVVKVLMFIPFVFILAIYIISPEFFKPLLSSGLGYFFIFIMICIFGGFVAVINKVMKIGV